MGNTFEQYTGLKSCAASPFSEKSIHFSQKSQNRSFLPFEQYAGLESQEPCSCSVQAAQGRAMRPGSLQGSRVPRAPRMPEAVVWLFPGFLDVPACAAGTVG